MSYLDLSCAIIHQAIIDLKTSKDRLFYTELTDKDYYHFYKQFMECYKFIKEYAEYIYPYKTGDYILSSLKRRGLGDFEHFKQIIENEHKRKTG